MARLVHWLVVSCSPLPPLLTLPTSPPPHLPTSPTVREIYLQM
ncbi:hypothetical protein [Fischerella thermalis]|nr:hypothetical protein [Fischerella thermalis]